MGASVCVCVMIRTVVAEDSAHVYIHSYYVSQRIIQVIISHSADNLLFFNFSLYLVLFQFLFE